jgi:hypothetical protein
MCREYTYTSLFFLREYVYLSEVEDVVIRVGHLPDKEVAGEEAYLVELVLVDGVVDDGVGGGVLCGDEALRGDHGDVAFLRGEGGRPRLDGGEEAVVVDVVVLLVVDVVVLVGAVRVVRVEVIAEVVVVAVGRGDVAPSPREGGEVRRAGAPERRGEERRRLGLGIGSGVVAEIWIGAVAGGGDEQSAGGHFVASVQARLADDLCQNKNKNYNIHICLDFG